MEFFVPYFIITINFPKENIKFGGSWYNFVLQHQAHYYFLDASDLTKEGTVLEHYFIVTLYNIKCIFSENLTLRSLKSNGLE